MKLSPQTNALILSHFTFKDTLTGAGAPHNLRNYLLPQIGTIAYIDHPFPGANFPSSQLTLYRPNQKPIIEISPKINLPLLILFFWQEIITNFWLIKSATRYQLGFALDNLSVISLWPLRQLGLVKTIIYYSIDYSPKRYSNSLINWLYHYLDRLASSIADINWVTDPSIILAKQANRVHFKTKPQIVPIGFDLNQLPPLSPPAPHKLIFSGVLYQKQGVQLILEALPQLISRFPKLHMTIIGDGDYAPQLKKLTKQLHLSKHVSFTGYINDHQILLAKLTQSGIGLAPYTPTPDSFTYFADPSKIKLYLACGLPLITTSVPAIASTITTEKLGLVIDYHVSDLVQAITKLQSPHIYLSYHRRALKFAQKFDINLIFSTAIKKL